MNNKRIGWLAGLLVVQVLVVVALMIGRGGFAEPEQARCSGSTPRPSMAS